MKKSKHRVVLLLIAACFALTALVFAKAPVSAFANAEEGASSAENARNEKLVVRYALDDTATGNGAKLAAQKWDTATQSFVLNPSADATVQNHVNNKDVGSVTSVDGIDGTAVKFTKKAHARASFQLPDDATGMTVSLWVKDINTYWSSLIEFWDGTNGGRLGKGTMQGNGGRRNEGDAWSSNCSAHTSATIAEGGGWDSFIIEHKNINGDNGGAAVDPMVADRWYHVSYVVTSKEMKAYRNGVLKQTFDKGDSATIAQSVMTAAKSNNGKLGIRLSLDSNDGDILDDLRIYSYAMTGEEVKEELYSNPSPIAAAITTVPEYYETIDGLGYPEEMLFDGAESVSDGADGIKTGVTTRGVTYSYKPVVGDTTPEKDGAGVKVTCGKDGYVCEETVRFRRRLNVKAESLGYRIGNGESVPIAVPESAGKDIIVKVAADTDLSAVKAGDIAVKRFEQDGNAAHYTARFTYSANTRTATVRCSYTPYTGFDTLYTIKFVKKSTDTFTALRVAGGKSDLRLTKEDFKENSAEVLVGDLNSFTLNVSLTLAEGAALSGGGNEVTFTQSDLRDGKLAFTVINENGDSAVYYLAPYALSSDATLSALSAHPYELNFTAGATKYSVTANKGEGAAVYAAITATANASEATVKKFYDVTENVVTVTVTAEDGSALKYVIEIRELDTDATLSEIRADGTAIADFDPEKSDYTVKYAGEKPTVTATAVSAAANVSTADADGKTVITVTAENGATKEYTVTLIKKSGDATLNKLTLNGAEIAVVNNSAEYLAPVGTRINGIAVIAEAAAGAHVSHRIEADENRIIVTVTAEDGTTETYTVNVGIQSYVLTEGGVTEDNGPAPGGCGAYAGGTVISVVAFALTAGVWLFVKRERKSR